MKLLYSIIPLICVFAGCDSKPLVSQQSALKVLHGNTMGTTFEIKLGIIPQDCDLQIVSQAIENKLQLITTQMSTWEQQSEISRFNRSTSTDWFPVSPEFAFVVSRSLYYWERTSGKFDITVPPLLEIWNFGQEEMDTFTPPTAEQIKTAQEFVNSSLLEVTLSPPSIKKLKPEVKIEVAAIAQGYGIDLICQVLEEFKIENYMVEIGGELCVKGTKLDAKPWRIAIEKPVAEGRQIALILELAQGAVGTSGNYRHFTIDHTGHKYSHIINPQTGLPVNHQLVSVSIVTPLSSLDADALTTSLMVMGPEAGYNWAEELNIAAIFFEELPDGTLKITRTSAFKQLKELSP